MLTKDISIPEVGSIVRNIPIYEDAIFNLLNNKGEVKWKFKNCFAVYVFGEEKARSHFIGLLRGDYMYLKLGTLFFFLLTWAVISCLVVFFHLENEYLKYCYIVYSILIYLGNFYVFSFFFDQRILRMVLKNFFFWGHLFFIVQKFIWLRLATSCILHQTRQTMYNIIPPTKNVPILLIPCVALLVRPPPVPQPLEVVVLVQALQPVLVCAT